MVMGAQDFVSFGYRSQSRETMEVGYSAKSECYGAFERRRETSTTGDTKVDMGEETAMETAMGKILAKLEAKIDAMRSDMTMRSDMHGTALELSS